MASPVSLAQALDVARRAVAAAGAAALPHWSRGVAVETKPDASPVTVADRQAEAAMLGIIGQAFASHAILGEETGAHPGDPEWRWIIDPIDGTRGFTRGGLFWGPLCALEHRGQIVVGAMALPALGESYSAADGLGAWKADTRLQLSQVSTVGEATICVGEPRSFARPARSPAMLAIMRSASCVRIPGDLGGAAYVLSGRADAWLEDGVQIWDIAPFPVLIREAGGRFSDLAGAPAHTGGQALVSNGLVHEELLHLLAG
jgi:histidinol-phosphatase